MCLSCLIIECPTFQPGGFSCFMLIDFRRRPRPPVRAPCLIKGEPVGVVQQYTVNIWFLWEVTFLLKCTCCVKKANKGILILRKMGRFNVDMTRQCFLLLSQCFHFLWFAGLVVLRPLDTEYTINKWCNIQKCSNPNLFHLYTHQQSICHYTLGGKRSRPQLILMFSNKKRKKQILGSSKSQENFMVQ